MTTPLPQPFAVRPATIDDAERAAELVNLCMMELIGHWIENPTNDNKELVRSSLDVTRSAHAWQQEQDVASFWILEAVDHASLAVWSGERASYIIPLDYATCAARSVACVLHAMVDAGVPPADAITSIVDVVAKVTS